MHFYVVKVEQSIVKVIQIFESIFVVLFDDKVVCVFNLMPRLRLLHNPKLDAVTLLPALLFVLVLSVFLRVLVRASFVRLIQTRQVLLS